MDLSGRNLQRTGAPCKPGLGSGSGTGAVSESSAGDVGDKSGLFSPLSESLLTDVILASSLWGIAVPMREIEAKKKRRRRESNELERDVASLRLASAQPARVKWVTLNLKYHLFHLFLSAQLPWRFMRFQDHFFAIYQSHLPTGLLGTTRIRMWSYGRLVISAPLGLLGSQRRRWYTFVAQFHLFNRPRIPTIENSHL